MLFTDILHREETVVKIRFWDRILWALSGLLIALAGLAMLVLGIGLLPVRVDASWLSGPMLWWQRALVLLVAAGLVALGMHGISMLFRRGREKGFIIQHSEYGDMSISMSALESMVKKCVASHQELTVGAIRIHHAHEGVIVEIKVTLLSGMNIPLTVNALQKQIKQYITSCSGVDVHKVRVMVDTDGTRLAPAATVAAEEEPATEPAVVVEQDFDQPVFQHEEDPEGYAPAEPAPSPEAGEEMPLPQEAAFSDKEENE